MQLQEENAKMQIPSLNSQIRFMNCKMQSFVWMIREIFKMLNQYAVDTPTLPVSTPPFRNLGGMLSHSLEMPSRNKGPPSTWDTHGISEIFFLQIQQRLLQHFLRQSRVSVSHVSEHTSPYVMSESPTVQDRRCQSRPSARNSVVPSEGGFFKELWCRQTTTADFRFSFWQITSTGHVCFLEVKISRLRYVLVHNFLRKLCNGSKKWRWLIQWMIYSLRHL